MTQLTKNLTVWSGCAINVYETKSHYKLILIVISTNKKHALIFTCITKNLSFSDIIGKRWPNVTKKDDTGKLAEALKPNLFKEL
jgi:hypothetical protein